jgi:UDP-N-acetylglucosamine--N-acetylmuramyl-(pentapeptide) pyrophosphoryl-undecaprenol N-acetylglucosamine transferase
MPRAEVTGAPIRRSIRAVDRTADRDAARATLGLPADRFVVAVMGGSLGSGVLNQAIGGYIADRRDDAGLAVRHAVGARYSGSSGPPGWDQPDGLLYQPVGFEPRMDLVYASADLLVGRGGATTVAEVAVTGTPAVLVPWSGAAEDHQTANVAWLADQDAAITLAERDVGRLGHVLDDLRADVDRRHALGERARAAGVIHRSDRIPHMIERVALASNPS